MRHEVLIDASAWVAVYDRSDQHHDAAVAVFSRIIRERRSLITTNLVVAEAYIIIRRAGGFEPALRFLESIHQTQRLQNVYSDPNLEEVAERILRQFRDHDLSLADAVSFAVMRERKITDAFTFDNHFTAVGFVQLS